MAGSGLPESPARAAIWAHTVMSTSTPTTMANGATQPPLCSWTQPITTGPVAARQ